MEQLTRKYLSILAVCAGVVTATGGSCSLSCPRPGDPADYTVCCTTNGVTTCCSWKLLAGILGGVFGGLILIGAVIGTVCCVKVKRGDWVCLKVRPGKYTMVTKATHEHYLAQQQHALQQRHRIDERVAGLENLQATQQVKIQQQEQQIADLQGQLHAQSEPPPAYVQDDKAHRY